MIRHLQVFIALACTLACSTAVYAKPKSPKKGDRLIPPPPVVISQNLSAPIALSSTAPADQYSIGSPTDEEQAFVELINRARADANAEAIRLANTTDPDVLSAIAYFGVNLPLMISQFGLLDQHLPPLSINTHLADMARLHSLDMFTNVFQGHSSSASPPAPFSAGDTLGDRLAEFPYSFTSAAENVFSYSNSVYYGHAGFEIDWGFGDTGMQDPAGHRLTIHNGLYREIGIGVQLGTNDDESGNGPVGPILVTQIFASQASPLPFITGVAYYDLNGNSFYDVGEGLGGLTVETTEGTGWAITADSGGYSIPVTSNGTYTTTFSGLNVTPQVTSVLISGSANSKQDLVLTYSAPNIIGTSNPITGLNNTYLITPTPGATAYKVRETIYDDAAWSEGAESGITGITITQSPGYEVIQSGLVYSGTYSFHLVHPAGISDEIIEIEELFLPTATSEILFSSRLRTASSDQFAMVDISVDEGSTWVNLYSQAGLGIGEPDFINRSIPIGSYAGIPVKMRFRYSFSGGTVFPSIATNYGWFIDGISVSDALRVAGTTTTIVTNPTFEFNPSTSGPYGLSAQPFNNSRGLPIGQTLSVIAGTDSEMTSWRTSHFSPADLADPSKEATVWGDDADPEKDGLNNLMEFALNGDPNANDSADLLPEFTRIGNTLGLTYTKFRNEVNYSVRTSETLESGTWTATGVVQDPDPAFAPTGTTIEATTTLTNGRGFLELEVTTP